jgi:diaminopimelate decarboxylase
MMNTEKYWWERTGLGYSKENGKLLLAGREVQKFAEYCNTPVYIYDAGRVTANISRLKTALEKTGLPHRLFYAMKSNRYQPLLTHIKKTGFCGIDACSPRELLFACQSGFLESEVSYTETYIHCDSLSSIRRIGEQCPGREIGIRINPALGVGYSSHEVLRYCGDKTTKFGIYKDRFQEAIDLAATYGMSVTGLHFHTGCGYLTPQTVPWEGVLEAAKWFIAQTPDLKHINVGGGLGIPLVAEDSPLDLDIWTGLLQKHFQDSGVEIWVEPGDYFVKDSGVLVMQINTVEKKQDTLFIGVNGGFNIHLEPAFYKLPLEVVPCNRPSAGTSQYRTTVAGNINEALDILAENILLPEISEGDYLAFLNSGGYGSAMSSNHCMRGLFSEYIIF